MSRNNTGDYNSGYYNSGDYNSGNRNSGNRNSGYYNSGDYNSGYYNSGNRNSGYYNSGDYNSGDYNSGNYNSGDYNSGNYNSGNYNSGSFNTTEPKMRLFNKELDMTVSEFNKKYNLYTDIPLNRWINKEDMSDEEKSEIEGWEIMGGYLKTLEFKEACRIWWDENPGKHEKFLTLPGFDADIFEEITGINVNKQDDKMQEAMELLKKHGYKVVKE